MPVPTQLAFEHDPAYETEHIAGATSRTFPVLITPTLAGCAVDAPADVEYRAHRYETGEVVVVLRFTR